MKAAPGLRRGFAFRLAAELLAKGLAFAVSIVMTRFLGPAEWGRMQWALALAALAGALADFGLASLSQRELSGAKPSERAGWIKAAWSLKALLWSGALACFACLSLAYGSDSLGLLATALAYVAALSLAELTSIFFVGMERLDLDFQVSLAGKLLQVAAAVLALALGAGAAGVLLAMALAGLAGWIWGLGRLGAAAGTGAKAWLPKRKLLGSQLWPYGLMPLVALAAGKADTILLERMQGAASVGVYQAAYKFIEALAFVPVAFMAAIYPSLARAKAEGAGTARAEKSLGFMGSLAAGGLAFLWAVATLLPRLLGPAYAGAPPYLRVLSLSMLATFPNFVLVNLLVISRRQSKVLVGACLALAFNLGANLAVIPAWGAQGAAWTTVGTEFLVSASAFFFLAGVQPAWAALRRMLLSAGCGGLGAGLAWCLKDSTAGSFLALAGAPALALAAAAALGLFPREEWDRLLKRIKGA